MDFNWIGFSGVDWRKLVSGFVKWKLPEICEEDNIIIQLSNRFYQYSSTLLVLQELHIFQRYYELCIGAIQQIALFLHDCSLHLLTISL